MFACVFVCSLAYLKNHMSIVHEFPMHAVVLPVTESWSSSDDNSITMYFRLSGWHHIFTQWAHTNSISTHAHRQRVAILVARGRHTVWLCCRVQWRQTAPRERSLLSPIVLSILWIGCQIWYSSERVHGHWACHTHSPTGCTKFEPTGLTKIEMLSYKRE